MANSKSDSLGHGILDVVRAQREDIRNLDAHIVSLGRRVLLANLVSYSLFMGLCVVASYLVVRVLVRQAEQTAAREHRERLRIERQLDALQKKWSQREQERRKHHKVLLYFLNAFARKETKQALELERRAQEAATGQLEQAVVSFISARLHELAARGALADGLSAYFNGQTKRAFRLFVQGLKYASGKVLQMELNYYAGLAAYKLGDFPAAATHLGRVAASADSASLMDDVGLFRLAHSHEILKHVAAARRFYRLLLDRYPRSPVAAVARTKLKELPRGP